MKIKKLKKATKRLKELEEIDQHVLIVEKLLEDLLNNDINFKGFELLAELPEIEIELPTSENFTVTFLGVMEPGYVKKRSVSNNIKISVPRWLFIRFVVQLLEATNNHREQILDEIEAID